LGYEHLASFDVGYYRGIEQSVLSRFPITHAEVWPNLPLDDVRRNGPGFAAVPPKFRHGLTMQRSPLRADIRVDDDYELTLFVIHHKSGGDFRFQREAEAIRTIELIDEVRRRDRSRNIVVLGDFNAAPWDKSLRLYLAAGLVDVMAHRIIPRWKDADQAEPNLYKTHESDRVLDYILLNSAAHREFVIGSAHVFGTLYDPEYDWRTDPYPKGYASDHYPVIIDLIPGDVL
jgi:endonuclease/exonuclease/phosphatase family metal-dependent hydrolase